MLSNGQGLSSLARRAVLESTRVVCLSICLPKIRLRGLGFHSTCEKTCSRLELHNGCKELAQLAFFQRYIAARFSLHWRSRGRGISLAEDLTTGLHMFCCFMITDECLHEMASTIFLLRQIMFRKGLLRGHTHPCQWTSIFTSYRFSKTTGSTNILQ